MQSKAKILVALVAILLLGAYLRIENLPKESYWIDEAYTANAVLSMQERGYDHLGRVELDSGRQYQCFLYCWPAKQMQTFTNTETALRLPAAIFGIISILIVFLLSYTFSKDRLISLTSALLLALSYWQVAWSRQARPYTLSSLLLLLFELAIFYWTFRRGGSKALIVALVFLALSIGAHPLALLGVPVLLISFFLKIEISNNRIKLALLFASLSALIFVANIINWPIELSFDYKLPYYLSFFLREYWIFVALACLAYFESSSDKRMEFIQIALLPIIALLALSFSSGPLHYRYLFPFSAPLFVLASSGLIGIGMKFQDRKKQTLYITLPLLYLIISKDILISPQSRYELESHITNKNSAYFAYTPQADWRAAYQFIVQEKQTNDIVISSQAVFNKLYLNSADWWLAHDYLGRGVVDESERYVGANSVRNLADLEKLVNEKDGFIVFDHMARDGRIDEKIIQYIKTNHQLIYHKISGPGSEIWVYRILH